MKEIQERINKVADTLNNCANGLCETCECYSPCSSECQNRLIVKLAEECKEIEKLIREEENNNDAR